MADEIEVKLNGKQFGFGAASQGLVIMLIGALCIWVARVGMDMRDFMNRGDRCTAGECGSMQREIDMHRLRAEQYRGYDEQEMEEIKLEQQRLQRGIDRLEDATFESGRHKPPLQPYGSD